MTWRIPSLHRDLMLEVRVPIPDGPVCSVTN